MFRECFQHLPRISRQRILMPGNVKLRLNRGERPNPLPTSLQGLLADALTATVPKLQQYPSYQSFYAELGVDLGLDADWLCLGAGSEELIRSLMLLTCDPGDTAAVLPYPTCAMFDIYARAFGVTIRPFYARPDEVLPAKTVLDNLKDRTTRVLFLVNPGQVVETYYLPYQIKYLADVLAERNCLLVVDEAHHGFGAESAIQLLPDCSNLVVLRTFSKMYGAAAIRVGYAAAQPAVIRYLDAIRPSGEIAGPSMAAAQVLMRYKWHLALDIGETIRARDWLREELCGYGVSAYGRYGFSVLIQLYSAALAAKVGWRLAQRGVLVKYGFPGPVANCLHLALGDMKIAAMFLAEFKAVLND